MPDAGVPQSFNITLEQTEHVVHLYMGAEFTDGFVTPRLVGVWGTGGGLFQVELEFDRPELAITTQRQQFVQVWTTLGNPADGPCTVYIKEARSRTVLKVVNFTRARRVAVANNAQATLYVQHLLGDIRFGMVSNDLLPNARFYAPRTFNHTFGATYWPANLELRVRAAAAITNVNVGLTSAVPGLSVTAVSTQQKASMAVGEEFAVLFRLEGINIAIGVHDLSYNITYDTPTGSLSGTFPCAVMDPGIVTADALTASTTATVPWAYKAGNFTMGATRREPVLFPAGGGTAKVTLWGVDEYRYPDLNIPVGELGSFSAVGATDNVGAPPVAVVDAAGALVGSALGAGKRALDGTEQSLKGTATDAAVGAGVASAGVVRVVASGIQAVGNFLGRVFCGHPKVLYEPGRFVYEGDEYRSSFFYVTVGGTQVSVAMLGQGDPYPGSPVGSNVLSATAVPF
ncbi:MAG: hypothetical protein ACKOCB_00025 [Planctomycetia bacterium]